MVRTVTRRHAATGSLPSIRHRFGPSAIVNVLSCIVISATAAAGLYGCGKVPAPQVPATAASDSTQRSVPAGVPAQARSLPNPLPALYTGLLPCADCEGIRYEIDLRADRVYFSRMTYLGKEPVVAHDEIGQWNITDDDVLVLHGQGDRPEQFALADASVLRKLDMNGQPIASGFNYSLQRQQIYAPLEPQLSMRGMYRPAADVPVYEECLTGLNLPVSMDGDGAALRDAYSKVRREPDQAVLASLEGRIVHHDDAQHDLLIVTRLDRFWLNESCGARGVTHDLENTRWVLVRLGDETVQMVPGAREPYIALEPTAHRISGHGGCNRLAGSYELDGSRLRFTQLALTRMACADMKYETDFARALNATASWKITGNHLDLLDANGATLARFEERNL